jgi:hypothetical protein
MSTHCAPDPAIARFSQVLLPYTHGAGEPALQYMTHHGLRTGIRGKQARRCAVDDKFWPGSEKMRSVTRRRMIRAKFLDIVHENPGALAMYLTGLACANSVCVVRIEKSYELKHGVPRVQARGGCIYSHEESGLGQKLSSAQLEASSSIFLLASSRSLLATAVENNDGLELVLVS